MLELVSLIKYFHDLLSSGSDSLSSVAKQLNRTNLSLDEISKEIKNLSSSVDFLRESIEKIPEIMIEIKTRGREHVCRGHVISAYKALKAGVVEDARIELNNAKANAITNWSLWVGYVWLHFLESKQFHKSDNSVEKYTPTLEEKRDALEKATRYVYSETDELDVNCRLSLLFTISGIIHVYGMDDLLLFSLECILTSILSEESYPAKQKIKLAYPLKNQVLKIENTQIENLYYQVVDCYFQEIVAQNTIEISKYSLGSYERYFTGIQNLVKRMRSVASQNAITEAITLFSELNTIMTKFLRSELESLSTDSNTFDEIKNIVTEIDVVQALHKDNSDNESILHLKEIRQQVPTKVCEVFKKKISITDQWSTIYFETIKSDLLSCQDILKNKIAIRNDDPFDSIHHFLIEAKLLYEKKRNNLKELKLLEFKVSEKKFPFKNFSEFFQKLGGIVLISAAILSGICFMLIEESGSIIGTILQGVFFTLLIGFLLFVIIGVIHIVIFSPSTFIYRILNKRVIERLKETQKETNEKTIIIETEIQNFLSQL